MFPSLFSQKFIEEYPHFLSEMKKASKSYLTRMEKLYSGKQIKVYGQLIMVNSVDYIFLIVMNGRRLHQIVFDEIIKIDNFNLLTLSYVSHIKEEEFTYIDRTSVYKSEYETKKEWITNRPIILFNYLSFLRSNDLFLSKFSDVLLEKISTISSNKMRFDYIYIESLKHKLFQYNYRNKYNDWRNGCHLFSYAMFNMEDKVCFVGDNDALILEVNKDRGFTVWMCVSDFLTETKFNQFRMNIKHGRAILGDIAYKEIKGIPISCDELGISLFNSAIDEVCVWMQKNKV